MEDDTATATAREAANNITEERERKKREPAALATADPTPESCKDSDDTGSSDDSDTTGSGDDNNATKSGDDEGDYFETFEEQKAKSAARYNKIKEERTRKRHETAKRIMEEKDRKKREAAVLATMEPTAKKTQKMNEKTTES